MANSTRKYVMCLHKQGIRPVVRVRRTHIGYTCITNGTNARGQVMDAEQALRVFAGRLENFPKVDYRLHEVDDDGNYLHIPEDD